MAEVAAKYESLRQQRTDVGSRIGGPSRQLIMSFACTAVTAITFLLSDMLRSSLEAMPQSPPYQIRNETILYSRPALEFGDLAPESIWEFNAEALAKIRNATMRLHPAIHHRKTVLKKLSKQATVQCTANGTSCPSAQNSQFGPFDTCAVVASSGILLGSHCGAEIDSKDYVIRMDLPLIKGYEKDVGRRTNMTVLNANTPHRVKASSRLTNRTQDVYQSRFKNIDGTVLVGGQRSRGKLVNAVKFYNLSFSLFTSRHNQKGEVRRLASRIAHRKFKGNPTLGLVTVLMMTTFCDHPYLYGFFPFQKDANGRDIPYHYYPGDYIKPVVQNEGGHHHMDREYDFFRDLHKQGVLKLHVGPCEGK